MKSSVVVYSPALFSFALAALFIAFPLLAVLAVSGALITFGLVYATAVYRFQQFTRTAAERTEGIEVINAHPSFKNVTVHMWNKGPKFW